MSAHNGMNLYRGCTHGCIYCDSRSACYQINHDFEDVEIKVNAPELLEDRLRRKRQKCMIGTGSMCDPYMHCEEELGLTRECLEIIRKYGFGLSILTKSDRILRDLPLLQEIHMRAKCVVQMTMTTFDEQLCRIIEPNVCTTRKRVEVLKVLRDHGIPTVVWMSPILPFINDTEENIRGLLNECFEAGVKGILCFGMGMTLREGNREYFYQALDRYFPGLREKYHRKYGLSYEIVSDQQEPLMKLFHEECRKHGVMSDRNAIFTYLNQFPEQPEEQLRFF